MTAQTDLRRRSRSEPSSTPLDRGELRRKLEKAAPILAGRMGNVPRDEPSERIVGFTLHEDIVGLSPGLFMLEAARDVLLAAPSVLDAFDALEAERDGLRKLADDRGDNLIVAVSKLQASEAQVRELVAGLGKLAGAVSWIEAPFIDAATPVAELRKRITFCVADARLAQAQARLALSVTPAAETDGWLPIESAPKDGTEVDLWLAPVSEDGFPLTPCRLPNAHFHCGEWLFWGGDPEIGWLAVGHRVTHWRPPPTPPAAEKPQQEGER